MTHDEEVEMMAVNFDLRFALGSLLDSLPADLPHRDYYEGVIEAAKAKSNGYYVSCFRLQPDNGAMGAQTDHCSGKETFTGRLLDELLLRIKYDGENADSLTIGEIRRSI